MHESDFLVHPYLKYVRQPSLNFLAEIHHPFSKVHVIYGTEIFSYVALASDPFTVVMIFIFPSLIAMSSLFPNSRNSWSSEERRSSLLKFENMASSILVLGCIKSCLQLQSIVVSEKVKYSLELTKLAVTGAVSFTDLITCKKNFYFPDARKLNTNRCLLNRNERGPPSFGALQINENWLPNMKRFKVLSLITE